MVKRSLRRNAGLTMIEVVVASIILTAIVGMSSYLVWNTSRTVASAEVGLQLENNAREFLSTLTKELHQGRMGMVRMVPWDANVMVKTTSFSLGTPGPYVRSTGTPPGIDGIIPATATTFRILNFKLPGKSMDLTKTNASVDADPNMFNLKMYKDTGGVMDTDYTYEIQYWWEIDNGTFKAEGAVGAGPGGFVPNNFDDNKNGLRDEGVIRKAEIFYRKDGSIDKRNISTVLRNVPWVYDPAFPNDWTKGRPGLVFCIPDTDGSGVVYTSAGTEKRIYVNVTLEAEDPRYPGMKNRNYFRTFATYIDLRNLN
jgi:hypothetical protein